MEQITYPRQQVAQFVEDIYFFFFFQSSGPFRTFARISARVNAFLPETGMRFAN